MSLVERRIGLLFVAFALLLAAAGARAGYLGALRSPALKRAALRQQVVEVAIPAPRGAITDRHGVPLAVSEQAFDIAVTPYLVRDPGRQAARLAPLLGVPRDALLRAFVRRDTGFAYLARQVLPGVADRVRRLDAPGIELIPRGRRTYPRSWSASQVIGHVGTDDTGLAGLEYSRDRALRGRDGLRRIVRDALGQPISLSDLRSARPGLAVRTTIDAALQDEVESVLGRVGERYRPRGATAIVMDPRTGEVLALANWPRVDANDPSGAPAWAQGDRAVGFTYEPGSTFKAITVAGALEEGAVTPDTEFDLPVAYRVADRVIHDAEPRGPERLSVRQILAQSSNVGAVQIGQRLGAGRFDTWVHRFGFGRPTGVDLPGEERGIVLTRARYSGSSMGNLPIGQGESVTPMQMATAYAAIADGGILRPPHIVRAVGGRAVPVPRGHRVISPQVAAGLRGMLRGVLAAGGTASEAAIHGYDLAGKTGTASKPDPATGGYSDSRYVASFVGFVPVHRPRLLVAVVVDEPHGAIYGGVVAAPAFQSIVAWAVPYLGISPR